MSNKRILISSLLAAAMVATLLLGRPRAHRLPRVAARIDAPRFDQAQARPAPEGPRHGIDRLPVAEYGNNPDAFIHQRHDYPPDTPERLGPKVGRMLFDLETVVDTVASGHEPCSRIDQARGKPLDADEQQAARQVLQEFFDKATPIVDATLEGELSVEDAFLQLQTMRVDLNCKLMASLALDEPQLLVLWAQMEGFTDEGCSGRAPKGGPEVIPQGFSRRGESADVPPPGKH